MRLVWVTVVIAFFAVLASELVSRRRKEPAAARGPGAVA